MIDVECRPKDVNNSMVMIDYGQQIQPIAPQNQH